MRRRARFFCVAATIFSLAACYTPGRSLAPAGSPIATSRDLTGAWLFTSGSSREYRSGIGALRFAPMSDVRENSVISVRHTGDLIVFDYTSHDGT
jgi:hypothetical protein